MKQTLFFIILFSGMQLFAQNDNGIFSENEKTKTQTLGDDIDGYAYEAGQKALEINFNPQNIFGSNSGDVFSLINNGIKYRSFNEDGKAMRLGVNIGFLYDTNIIQQADSDLDLLELKEKTTAYELQFMLGFEKHFMVNPRVSPYAGFQFMLGYGGSKKVLEHQKGSDIYTEELINSGTVLPGTLSFGAGLITGLDYFIFKHVYLGVELGLGAEYTKIRNTKYINEDDSDLDFEMKNGSSFLLSPGLTTGSFRLGWVF